MVTITIPTGMFLVYDQKIIRVCQGGYGLYRFDSIDTLQVYNRAEGYIAFYDTAGTRQFPGLGRSGDWSRSWLRCMGLAPASSNLTHTHTHHTPHTHTHHTHTHIKTHTQTHTHKHAHTHTHTHTHTYKHNTHTHLDSNTRSVISNSGMYTSKFFSPLRTLL